MLNKMFFILNIGSLKIKDLSPLNIPNYVINGCGNVFSNIYCYDRQLSFYNPLQNFDRFKLIKNEFTSVSGP